MAKECDPGPQGYFHDDAGFLITCRHYPAGTIQQFILNSLAFRWGVEIIFRGRNFRPSGRESILLGR